MILIFLIASCKVQKQPIFVKVDQVQLISITADTIKLKALAFFENPNAVSGTITADDIKILVNGAAVAQVFSEPFEVPANRVFSIPLTANISTKNILTSNKNGLLGGLINSLLTKKVTVQIKGNLQYVVFGFKRAFLIDKTQEIKF